MNNIVKVEAKYADELFTCLTEWKNLSGNKKLLFIYDPRDNGWRYRIVLLLNEDITQVLHGELEPDAKGMNSPLNLLKLIIKQSDIESYYCENESDTWLQTGMGISNDDFLSESYEGIDSNKIITEFAKKRKTLLTSFLSKRPKPTPNAKQYILSRSMGCCEFEYCAEPLFKGKEGEYGNYGYFAHIIGASVNGPRSESLVSSDEITDPQNFLFLCDKHHRLIDKVDPEFYGKYKLREMLEKRKKQRELLATQLKYEEVNSLAILSDIAGIPVGISSDETLKAMLNQKLQPLTDTINQKYLGDKKNGHEVLASKAKVYWSNFLNAYEQEINSLKNLVNDDSKQAVRYQKLAIFPLGNMPTMFLAGYIIGEARPITLFHRDRNRDGGTWLWDNTEKKTHFSWGYHCSIDESNTDVVVLTLEITAKLTDDLIPDEISHLPRISIIADKLQQNPFGSIQDFECLRFQLQEAINAAQDTLKAKHIHIICIAPAVAVFALGQKFQRRNSAQLHIYQVGKDTPYYSVFSFNRDKVSITNCPETEIKL